MPHDKNWRRGRAALVNFLKDEELAKVLPIQEAESTQMVFEVLQDPDGYEKHVLRAFCAVILESVYGLRGTRALTDRFFEVQDEWAGMLDMGAMPPLDVFPWLKYVPSVLTPWPGWRKRSAELSRAQRGFYEGLFEKGKGRAKARGTEEGSFLARLLARQEKEGFTDVEMAYLAGFLIEAGADTTAVALLVFVLSMAAHEDVQKRAQEEIDGVFGDEMPSKVDRAKLPYLGAVFWEVSIVAISLLLQKEQKHNSQPPGPPLATQLPDKPSARNQQRRHLRGLLHPSRHHCADEYMGYPPQRGRLSQR